MRVLELKQERSCKGCMHEGEIFISFQPLMYCKKGKQHSDNGGHKCKLYKEAE